MVAMPSATPTADSAARAGLLTRPSAASGAVSAGRSRLPAGPAGRGAVPLTPRPLSCSMQPSRSRITRRAAAASPGCG